MLKLKIDTTGQAFEDGELWEIARLLVVTEEKLREGKKEFILYDINGNSVGEVKLTGGN